VDGFSRAVHAMQSIIVRSSEVIIIQYAGGREWEREREIRRERGGEKERERDRDIVSSRTTLLSPLARIKADNAQRDIVLA